LVCELGILRKKIYTTTSLLRRELPDFDEIWLAAAKQHAGYDDMVEIETGSRIPIWRG